MKCGQLMEYNTKNIYLEIEYNIRNILLKNQGKNVAETLSETFLRKRKLSISLDQQSEILHSLFLLYIQVADYQSTLKVNC